MRLFHRLRLSLGRAGDRRGSSQTFRWNYPRAFRPGLRRLSRRAWTRQAMRVAEPPPTLCELDQWPSWLGEWEKRIAWRLEREVETREREGDVPLFFPMFEGLTLWLWVYPSPYNSHCLARRINGLFSRVKNEGEPEIVTIRKVLLDV